MRLSILFPTLVAASAAVVLAAGSDSEGGTAAPAAPVRPVTTEQAFSETRAYVTFPARPLESYAGLAEALVQADVVGIRTIDIVNQPLRTEYELRVADCYFGDVDSTVRVQVAGGRTDTRSFIVEGAPNLVLGAQGVFFLGGRTEGDALSFLGLSRGCYAVHSHGGVVQVSGGEHAAAATPLDQFVVSAIDARELFLSKEVR
ncbi:MAG: hypothetical protein ACI80K_000469 [Paracoccaceae bacterium]|jgi:hypothetical protein